LRGDRLISTLVKTHPEVNIQRHPTEVGLSVRERTPYMLNLLRQLTAKDPMRYVLDSALLSPQLIHAEHQDLIGLVELIFVGYPSLDIDEKLESIYAHAPKDSECVSHGMKSDELRQHLVQWKDASRDQRDFCIEAGFIYVDTSFDFIKAISDGVTNVIDRQ